MMMKLAAALLLLSSLVSCDQAEQPKDLLCDICVDIVTDIDEWITSDSTMDDIINFVNSRVDADYKKIRGRVLFRKVLPRNTSGKLLRREMRRWAEEEAEKEKL